MTIELTFFLAIGVAIIFWVAANNWLKVLKAYKVERKGKNWVVRDKSGRFVRITPNFFDVLSLGVYL